MGLLIAIALVLGACYSPDIRDCTLACAHDSDCVREQICTADHFCASPTFSNGCSTAAPDAAVDGGHHDARPPDAAPDASPFVDLHIHIDGPGTVTLTGGGTCAMIDCTMPVLKGVPATVTAIPHADKQFDHWTSMTCMNQPAICTFTPASPTTVAAKFK